MTEGTSDARLEAPLRRAMNLSVVAGLLMLVIKGGAWLATGSTAILSDAAESVVHMAAVVFASYSLRLSFKPADEDHPYGHAKISYFSAGFEGAMIALVALYILYAAAWQALHGPHVGRLGLGTVLTAAATILNGALGWYLLRVGRENRSLIIEANGRDVLTDCWTSLGVIIALVLAITTGWLYWDPVIAVLLALNILRSGFGLMRRSASGLMDQSDPAMTEKLSKLLDDYTTRLGIRYHLLRHRNLGNAWWVEMHLLFPKGTLIETAHLQATEIEDAVEAAIPGRAWVTTHLEPIEGHDAAHRQSHFPHRR